MVESTFAGLKVVECGNFISAAYFGKLFADLGAEVLKIESTDGGDESRRYGPFPEDIPHPEKSGLFLYLNSGKQCITLNLEVPSGQALLNRLLEDADVLVSNYHPRDLQRLGLDPAPVLKQFPQLIYACITPYGLVGPYAEHSAYDINMCGAGGISVGVGEPNREPLTLPLNQAEYQAGLNAMGATVTALIARDFSGKGQLIDVSGEEVMATLFSGISMATYVYRGVSGIRQGHRGGLGNYPRTCLPCKDGYIGITTPQVDQWYRFLEVMGNPEWSQDPRFRDRRQMTEQYADEVDEHLIEWLSKHTKQEIFDLCRAARIPCAPVMDAADLVNSGHLKERAYFVEVDHPEVGRLPYPGAPYKFSDTVWAPRGPAPLLGQHNEDVFCGRLGMPKDELVRLRNAGVI